MKNTLTLIFAALLALSVFTGCKKDDGQKPETNVDQTNIGMAVGNYDNLNVWIEDPADNYSTIFGGRGQIVVSMEGQKKVLTITQDIYTFKLNMGTAVSFTNGTISAMEGSVEGLTGTVFNLSGASQTIGSGLTGSFDGNSMGPRYNGIRYSAFYGTHELVPDGIVLLLMDGMVAGIGGNPVSRPVQLSVMTPGL